MTQTDRPNTGIPAAGPHQEEPPEPAEAIGYIRCSTGRQADSGLGTEAQTTAITTWCTYK